MSAGGEGWAARQSLHRPPHAARVLIDQHGADAPVEAAMRVDAMLEAGDLEGRAVWRRILAAVEELLRTEPKGRVH